MTESKFVPNAKIQTKYGSYIMEVELIYHTATEFLVDPKSQGIFYRIEAGREYFTPFNSINFIQIL